MSIISLRRPWTIIQKYQFHLLAVIALSGGFLILARPLWAGMFHAKIYLGDMSGPQMEACIRQALSTESQLHVTVVREFQGGSTEHTITDRKVVQQLADSFRITSEKIPFGACACRHHAIIQFKHHRGLSVFLKSESLMVWDSSDKMYLVKLDPAFETKLFEVLQTNWWGNPG
jgi:hypothetical protein